MTKITAATKILGIIGDPVGHSKSPELHRCFAELTNTDYVYHAFHVTGDRLAEAIAGVRALGIAGVNVTAPHKLAVMQYLDEISDEAKRLGSVNTVVNRNGCLCGYNTDAQGFYKSVLRAGGEIKGKDVLIFGAGGATQPIAVLFAAEGAKTLTVINRTEERAKRLAEYTFNRTGKEVLTKRELAHYDVVINTTSAGMKPQLEALPSNSIDFIDENTFVADMIYNPRETRFLAEARRRGAKTVNGLGMLIYQGILAYELFTGTKLPENAYEAAERVVMP